MLKVMGWWAFDVFTLLASQLDQKSIAAQTILRNIGLFTYMIPVGLSSSINFFTGKYIGKQRVDLAHTMSNYTMYITYVWSVIVCVLLWLFED
jgi:Na+-driven multidrug efflux pump